MNDTRIRNGILCEFVGQQIADAQSADILLEPSCRFLHTQDFPFLHEQPVFDVRPLFEDAHGETQVFAVGVVVLHVLLVLLVHDVGYVGVDEEGVALEATFEEELFLFFEVEGF